MLKLSNGDVGAIFITKQSCAAPISKVETHISDRCAYYAGQLFVSTRKAIRYSVDIIVLTDQFSFLGKLPTYPSPNPTFCPK